MNCSINTMLKVAAVLGLALGAAYLAFPEAQTMVLVSAPYLLLLICPISMGIVMMLMMKGTSESTSNEKCGSTGAGPQPADPQAAAPAKV